MNEKKSKKREWVKNAAIIFLSVMLILTFFSNTIMNHSLPEIAAQYIQPGTITAKIRGTGTVEGSNPYQVLVNETRVVESVLVRNGDEVSKGDVLFVLADRESEELQAAMDALDSAMLDFELQILSGNISDSVINNVQGGKTSSISAYQSRILAAENEIQKWEKEIAGIEQKISQLNALQGQLEVSKTDTSKEEAALEAAQSALENDPVKQAKDRVSVWKAEIAEYQKVIDEYEKYNTVVSVSGNDVTYKVSWEEYHEAVTKKADRQNLIEKETVLADAAAVKAYEEKTAAVSTAQNNLNNAQNYVSNSTDSVSVELANWNLELQDKNRKLADANEAKAQLLADISAELNLGSKMEQIARQREEIARMQENASGSVIEAPISGKITELNITAGQETVPGNALAVMQPEGAEYTMSFTVTNRQAQKLSVGMEAELVNSWRYDDLTLRLSRMIPDPANPSQNKKLEFEVTGNVTAGETLNVSVGDKSANYDMTVPNSAIREDSNGTFILIVEAKSSPLGNRYKATRVDVEVAASDDKLSAIKGALEGYEYVITTSTRPVEAGQLVRFAEQ